MSSNLPLFFRYDLFCYRILYREEMFHIFQLLKFYYIHYFFFYKKTIQSKNEIIFCQLLHQSFNRRHRRTCFTFAFYENDAQYPSQRAQRCLTPATDLKYDIWLSNFLNGIITNNGCWYSCMIKSNCKLSVKGCNGIN